MKSLHYLSFVLLSMLFTSCSKEDSTDDTDNSVIAKTMLNVSYGSDLLQNMDIYLPEGRATATTKVIIMIHGGSWASGDKAELTPFVDTLKRRLPDYALFNINYRLSASPNNLFPTQEMDVKAALESIYGKRSEYLISDKFVLIGASAGGHLALLQGYKYTSPVKPKAIVSFAGPTDLNDMFTNPAGGNPVLSLLLASAIGKTPSQDPVLYTSSSPVNFVGSTAPPTLLLYGDIDPLVRPAQAVLLNEKLQAAGVIHDYLLFPRTAHVDTWTNAVFYESFAKVQAFLTANVL